MKYHKYLLYSTGVVLILAGVVPITVFTGGVTLEVDRNLGRVNGLNDTVIPVTVRNLSFVITNVLIPNSCCTVSGVNSFSLGPFESKRVDISLATHKFPVGPGSFPIAIEYVVRGDHRRAARSVEYEVSR